MSTNEHISFTIIDSGRGIPEEQLEKIGSRFFRADNSIGTSGSGIGLHIVERMVRMHRGTLSLKSELEKGTEVLVTLPRDVRKGGE